MKNHCCIVTALPAEAKPVISYYQLLRNQKVTRHKVYSNNDISLIISGVGKTHVSEAIHFMSEQLVDIPSLSWINFGIAGHESFQLGECFIANEIIDYKTKANWQLKLPPLISAPTEKITTLQKPEAVYLKDTLVDMEASGFVETARLYSDPSRVHCVKVISDNKEHPANQINAAIVSQLCEQNIATLDALVKAIV